MPISGTFRCLLLMVGLVAGSLGGAAQASEPDLCAQLTGCPAVRSEIQARAAGGGSLAGLGPWTIGIPAGFPEGGTLTMLPEAAFRVRKLDRNLFQVSLVDEAPLFRVVFGSRTLVPIGARYEVSGTGGSIGGGVTACELRVNFVTNAGDAIDPTLIPSELIRLSFQPAESARLIRVTREGFIIQRNAGFETASVRAALSPITDPVSGVRLEFSPQSLPFCGTAPQPAPQPAPIPVPTPAPRPQPRPREPLPAARDNSMFEIGAGFDLGTPGNGWASTYAMILRVESAWRSPIYVRAELGIGTYLGVPSDRSSTSPDWNSETGLPYINIKIEPITWTGKDDLFEENSKRTVPGLGFLPTEITRDMSTGEELTVKAAFANFMMRTENKTRREEDFKIFFRFATHVLGVKYQELVRHSFDSPTDESGDYENHRYQGGFGLSVGTATMEGGFRVQPAEWIAFKVTAGASGDLTLSPDLPITSFQSFVMGRAQFLGFWEAFVKYQYSVMEGDYEGTHFSVGVGRNF